MLGNFPMLGLRKCMFDLKIDCVADSPLRYRKYSHLKFKCQNRCSVEINMSIGIQIFSSVLLHVYLLEKHFFTGEAWESKNFGRFWIHIVNESRYLSCKEKWLQSIWPDGFVKAFALSTIMFGRDSFCGKWIENSCVDDDDELCSWNENSGLIHRNLYFRTSYLLLSGVRPVFVLEGAAPALKHAMIAKRNKIQFRGAAPRKNAAEPNDENNAKKVSNKGRTRSTSFWSNAKN